MRTGQGDRRLHRAAARGRTRVVRILLEHGADPNARGEQERTPLHPAAAHGHTGVVKLLVEHGADPNARETCLATPLHWAARYGHTQVVNTLIRNGAEVNARGQERQTPLHLAVKYGGAGTVQALLGHGADRAARETHERSALDLAVIRDDQEITKAVLEDAQQTDVSNEVRGRALLNACYAGDVPRATRLVAYGADPFLENNLGSAFSLAVSQERRRPGSFRHLLEAMKQKCPDKYTEWWMSDQRQKGLLKIGRLGRSRFPLPPRPVSDHFR